MKLTETRFLVFSVLAIFLLMAIHIFQSQIFSFYNPANYIGFHTLLESFSISISAAIFLYGLKSYGTNHSPKMLLLSFTFFLVGTLDIFHTLSYNGMPYFFTVSSVAKATWFWVSARILQSIFILVLIIFPDKKLKRDYRLLAFLAGMVIAATVLAIIIYYEKSLPILVVEGKGTTILKNSIEYAVSFILFVSLIVTLYQYYGDKREAKLSMALAFVFLLLSELVFTIYQSVYDLDNFVGHIFKVLGFYFILKSFYFPDLEKVQSEQEISQRFKKLPGFIFTADKRGKEFILTYSEGELLEKLGIPHQKIIGMPIAEVFSPYDETINEYCRLAINLQESIRFEITFLEKTFLISINPSYENDGQTVIIGTIIDMTGVHPDIIPKKPLQEKKKSFHKIVL